MPAKTRLFFFFNEIVIKHHWQLLGHHFHSASSFVCSTTHGKYALLVGILFIDPYSLTPFFTQGID